MKISMTDAELSTIAEALRLARDEMTAIQECSDDWVLTTGAEDAIEEALHIISNKCMAIADEFFLEVEQEMEELNE